MHKGRIIPHALRSLWASTATPMPRKKPAAKAKPQPKAPAPKPLTAGQFWAKGPSLTLSHLLLLGMLWAVAYIYVYHTQIDLNGDNVNYFLLGKALASGQGFVEIANIDKPAHTHFPPGYPALTVPAHWLTGSSIMGIKVFTGLFMLGAIIVLYYLTRRLLKSERWALVICLLVILNANLLHYASLMMSELPYTALTLGALLAMAHWKPGARLIRQPLFWVALGVAIVAYYVRGMGIALIAAGAVWLLFQKRWLATGAWVGTSFLLILPWSLRQAALKAQGYGHFLRQKAPYNPELGEASLQDILQRMLDNLGRYLDDELPMALFASYPVNYETVSTGGVLLGLIIVGLAGYGLFKLPHKPFRLPIFLYLGASAAILLVWPSVWTGIRFILPLVPLFVLLGVYGLWQLASKLAQLLSPQASINPAWMLLLFVFLIRGLSVKHDSATQPLPPQWHDYIELAKWSQTNLPADAVVACRKPAIFHLFSERYTTRYFESPEPQAVLDDLVQKRATHVVADAMFGSTMRYLYPAIQLGAQGNQFEGVRQLDSSQRGAVTYLLGFRHTPAAPPAAAPADSTAE